MSSELLMLLKHEARTHKLCGANALGKLFESAVKRIAELEKLVVMAHEMDTDSYTDIHSVKWLANSLIKEQGE